MSEPEDKNQKDGDSSQDKDDTKEEPRKITLCLLSTAFFTCIGSSFLYGYNLSVVNAPAPFIKSFINRTWIEKYGTPVSTETVTLLWSITVSILSIGGLIGSILVNFLLKALGRRGTLLVNNSFSLASAVLLSTAEKAHSFEMLIVGRFMIGTYGGVSLSVQNMYLVECSPRHIRGAITMFSSVMVSLGVLVGQIISLREIFGQESRWNFLFAVIAIPALVQLGGLFFMPESPRYLLMEKNDEAAAERALKRFHGKEDVTTEVEEIQMERQNNLQVVSVLQLLRDRTVRWQLITGIVLLVSLKLSGVVAVLYYTNVILTDAGISGNMATYITLSIGGTEVIFASCSNVLVERVGRRILIIVGLAGMAVCYGLLTVFLSIEHMVSWMPYLSFACILAVFAFVCLGPASVAFVLVSELFEQSHRPAAFSICGSLFWLSEFTIGLVFPFMQEALQNYVFLVFVVVCTVAAVYLFFVLPETKNKTFVEISQSFAKRNKLSTVQPDKQEQTISSISDSVSRAAQDVN
ncbi:solute carrier family 2, facilitated glucose transporter member 9-like [Genypterus blacodes]|uniref:solute carrier family 2, facilitated glucose transporter member 9-like n=1 Tax=Genypterus blacodes TaxID=154954 RepID=UPI003F765C90